jgi:hypothetical protein
MSVRPLPRRDRRASTKKAASINPTALVTNMRDTVQRISQDSSLTVGIHTMWYEFRMRLSLTCSIAYVIMPNRCQEKFQR